MGDTRRDERRWVDTVVLSTERKINGRRWLAYALLLFGCGLVVLFALWQQAMQKEIWAYATRRRADFEQEIRNRSGTDSIDVDVGTLPRMNWHFSREVVFVVEGTARSTVEAHAIESVLRDICAKDSKLAYGGDISQMSTWRAPSELAPQKRISVWQSIAPQ